MREKKNPFAKGHPRTLHLWWARRPHAACRAIIFCSLVHDPEEEGASPRLLDLIDELEAPSPLPAGWESSSIAEQRRHRLFKFVATLVKWENSTDEDVLSTARDLISASTDGNPPPLLDPFCGGGSIPLEAQRLGLEAHGSDLNPVAVLITKALVELPPKFAGMPPVNPDARAELATGAAWRGATGLAADVRWYGEWMRERAWERIGHLYPQGPNGATVMAWLWARTVTCPNPACGATMPLVSSFWLSRKRQRVYAVPVIDGSTVRFDVSDVGEPVLDGTVNRQGATCIVCHTATPFRHIREQGQRSRLGMQLMAVVEEAHRRRAYRAPTHSDSGAAGMTPPSDVPDTALAHNPRNFQTPIYGMTHYKDLFTPRQLTALTTFSDLVSEVRELIRLDASKTDLNPDEYADAVTTYLAFTVDRSADYGSALASWHNGADAVRPTFSRQAIAMIWDFAETNPFSRSAGSWRSALDYTATVLERMAPDTAGTAVQGDAATTFSAPVGSMVVTDPPYYDNIIFADISDFFYVWLRRSIGSIYPQEFATISTPKAHEAVAAHYRFDGDKGLAERHFEASLASAFSRINEAVTSDVPTSIFYAYKQSAQRAGSGGLGSAGWETMLTGLITAGFSISRTWPMRTEMTTRAVARESNALATSVVIVCRPRSEDAPMADLQEFNRALETELPDALNLFIGEHIAPVDLPQASIGPGMAVFSRYSAVVLPNGERMSVRRALELINEGVEQFFSEREGSFDTGTQFCLRWFEQFGFEDGAFGDADSIARAKDISVEELSRAGALTAQRGRVRLIPYERYEAGWQGWTPSPERPPTEWQACHYLAAALEHGGIRGQQGGTRGAGGGEHDAGGAARVARDLGGATAARAIELAYRLYAICDAKGWPAEARRYNALADSWQEISAAAQKLREREQPRLT